VSYTGSMSEDYIGGSNQNFRKVYQTIYVDRLGAKLSNMLIICSAIHILLQTSLTFSVRDFKCQ
jgi:hypothetical protein